MELFIYYHFMANVCYVLRYVRVTVSNFFEKMKDETNPIIRETLQNK